VYNWAEHKTVHRKLALKTLERETDWTLAW